MSLHFLDGDLQTRSVWTKVCILARAQRGWAGFLDCSSARRFSAPHPQKWRGRYFAIVDGSLAWWESEAAAASSASDGLAGSLAAATGVVALRPSGGGSARLAVIAGADEDDPSMGDALAPGGAAHDWSDAIFPSSARGASEAAAAAAADGEPVESGGGSARSRALARARSRRGEAPGEAAPPALPANVTPEAAAGLAPGLSRTALRAAASLLRLASEPGTDGAPPPRHGVSLACLRGDGDSASEEAATSASASAGAGAGLKEALILAAADREEAQLWVFLLRSLCQPRASELPAHVLAALAKRNYRPGARGGLRGLLISPVAAPAVTVAPVSTAPAATPVQVASAPAAFSVIE